MSRLPDDRSKLLEKLRREHAKLDQKVQALESQRWISPAEEAEMKRLKRLKLQKKDEMQHLTVTVEA
jgi:uncharacterized protein YdcH (DUF465 family)